MSTHPIGNSSPLNSDDARAQQLYQAGITAYKNGDTTKAHLFWQQSAHLNPKYRAVWLALYQVSKNDADRITCLENALRLNAKNPRIPERLYDLQRRQRIMNGIPPDPIPAQKHNGLWLVVGILFVSVLLLWVLWGVG